MLGFLRLSAICYDALDGSRPSPGSKNAASNAASSEDLELRRGQLFGADEIVEFGGLRLEMQLDGADRAVALLGDDDIGHAVGGLAAFLPAVVAVVELLGALLGAM